MTYDFIDYSKSLSYIYMNRTGIKMKKKKNCHIRDLLTERYFSTFNILFLSRYLVYSYSILPLSYYGNRKSLEY